jgi:hypothetical protein
VRNFSFSEPRTPTSAPRHRRRRDAARIRTRFGELHAERDQLQAQLGTLTAAGAPKAADTTLLDELPLAGDILPGLPAELKARLLEAFDIQVLWNKPGRQATVFAEITDATLRALPAILNPGQDGYDDTSEQDSGERAAVEDLFEAPIVHRINPIAPINHDLFRSGVSRRTPVSGAASASPRVRGSVTAGRNDLPG